MRYLLMLPIWVYRNAISRFTPPACRFRPTCSAYAMLALQRHGVWRGSWLALRRILRCHPFTEPDYDPVPPAAHRQRSCRPRRCCGDD